jgi:GTP-binding protein HflX
LFATLDPTVRRVRLPSGRTVTMSDTVGFVSHLPHQLVEAFRSTLEEVGESDVILHVIDGSDDAPEQQLSAVRGVLSELGVTEHPEVVVLNKCDIADAEVVRRMQRLVPGLVLASARTGEGIDDVLAAVDAALPHPPVAIDVTIPYDRGDLVARIHADGEVSSVEHLQEGTRVVAMVGPDIAGEVAEAVGVDTR